MIADLLMHWSEAVHLVDKGGHDAFLRLLDQKFPSKELYQVSTSWYTHGAEYVAKAKGALGDVIVGWHK